MADFPNLNALFPENDPNFLQSQARPLMRNWQEATMQMPGAMPTATFNIMNDSLTPTQASCRIDTEGGAPADDLRIILTTGIHNGAELFLYAADPLRIVTVKHQPGILNGISLDGGQDKQLSPSRFLRLKREGNFWFEMVDGNIKPPLLPPLSRELLTVTGTYTYTRTGWYRREALGGGGPGGTVYSHAAGAASAASGGGSGGYAEDLVYREAGDTDIVTIGAGGVRGSAGAAGPSGGATSIGTLTADGGRGGYGYNTTTFGTQFMVGHPIKAVKGGQPGPAPTIYAVISGGNDAVQGAIGASSLYGEGGSSSGGNVATASAAAYNGNPGTGYGSGGSGGMAVGAGQTAYGGNGTQGLVIVTFLGGGSPS